MEFHTRKYLFILGVLLFAGVLMAGHVRGEESVSNQQWKQWIGKRVNVTYACCGESACTQIRGAMLKEVAEKHIVVITKGAPLFLPVHMIKDVTLSNGSYPHSAVSGRQKSKQHRIRMETK